MVFRRVEEAAGRVGVAPRSPRPSAAVLDEPVSPSWIREPFKNEAVARGTKKIGAQNRFIVVAPEYNRGVAGYFLRAFPGHGDQEHAKRSTPNDIFTGRSGYHGLQKSPLMAGFSFSGRGDADQKRALLRTIVGISTRLMPISMRSRLEKRVNSSEASRYLHQVRKASAKRLIMIWCLSCYPETSFVQ